MYTKVDRLYVIYQQEYGITKSPNNFQKPDPYICLASAFPFIYFERGSYYFYNDVCFFYVENIFRQSNNVQKVLFSKCSDRQLNMKSILRKYSVRRLKCRKLSEKRVRKKI